MDKNSKEQETALRNVGIIQLGNRPYIPSSFCVIMQQVYATIKISFHRLLMIGSGYFLTCVCDCSTLML